MSPQTIAILASLWVMLVLSRMRAPRTKKKEWLQQVKPELMADSVQTEMTSFYDRNVRGVIEKNQGLYDQILHLFRINPETVAAKIQAAGKTWKADEIIAVRIGSILFGVALMLLAMCLGGGPKQYLIAIIVAAGGYMYPEMKLSDAIKARKKQIETGLPDFIDLLIVLLEVGTPEQDAMMQVSESFDGAIRDEFRRAAIAAKYNGGNWIMSLTDMASRLKLEDVTELVSTMSLAKEKGTPLSGVLRDLVNRIRFRQSQAIEERAQKLTVKMMPVMAIFIFIPMITLLLAPSFSGMKF